MRRGGPRSWLAVAAAAIVVTFAVQLALAAWNRGGETARLEMSGASLSLPWPDDSQEGEPLSLGLGVVPAIELSARELAALGFPLKRMEAWREDESHRSPLARSLWVVLDTSPQGWERYLRQKEEDLARREDAFERLQPERAERGWRDDSERQELDRLRRGPRQPVVAAAGRDRDELRRRFPDRQRQAVLRGTVTASHDPLLERWRGQPRLAVRALTVPPALHGPVRTLIDEWEARSRGPEGTWVDRAPAFRAVVAWGRRHEPWLLAVEPLPGRPPADAAPILPAVAEPGSPPAAPPP
jgi:hypothetical protein